MLHDQTLIDTNVLTHREPIIDFPVISQQMLASNGHVADVPKLLLQDNFRRNLESTHEKINKPNSLWSIVLVFSLHLLLLVLLGQLWSPSLLQIPVRSPYKPSKLNAYMYYTSNVKNEASLTQAAHAVVNIIQAEKVVSSRQTETKDTSRSATLSLSSKEEDKLAAQVPVAVEEVNTNSDDQALKALFKAMDNKTVGINSGSYYDSPSYNELKTKSDSSIAYFDNKTQRYLTRQNDQRLDNLVKDSADQFTQIKTLSEMDGEMIILQLPEVDTWSEAKTLDNALDPNRVVKQGDTCYRIVKTPNPINPHAENLGYPFRCDGDSVVESLKRAIAKRTYKNAKK